VQILYFQDEHYYSGSVDNLDRDLSSVSNSSASSGPTQDGPERGLYNNYCINEI